VSDGWVEREDGRWETGRRYLLALCLVLQVPVLCALAPVLWEGVGREIFRGVFSWVGIALMLQGVYHGSRFSRWFLQLALAISGGMSAYHLARSEHWVQVATMLPLAVVSLGGLYMLTRSRSIAAYLADPGRPRIDRAGR